MNLSAIQVLPLAAFLSVLSICTARTAHAEDPTEMLNITIGTPTKLSDLVYQNTSALLVLVWEVSRSLLSE